MRIAEIHRLTPYIRFLQKDPIGFDAGDANFFRYCGDDPVNRVDPSGLNFVPFNPGSDLINQYMGSYYQNNISPYNSGVAAYNRGVVYPYNSGLSLLSSAEFRFALGSIEIIAGVQSVGAGVPLLFNPLTNAAGQVEVMVGSYEILSGWKNVQEGANGKGFDLGPPLEPWKLETNLNFRFVSQSRTNITLFGTNTATGAAMFNSGQGWQPIGRASVDIRWAPNSGTGNWIAGQTTKYFLAGGGYGGVPNYTATTADPGHTIFYGGGAHFDQESGVIVPRGR